jgi:hypothetical protein
MTKAWREKLSTVDSCFLTAGYIGKVWKSRRRDLPSDVRALIAETLLALRSHLIPTGVCCGSEEIDSARYDIKHISGFLKSVGAHTNTDSRLPLESVREEGEHCPEDLQEKVEKVFRTRRVSFGENSMHTFLVDDVVDTAEHRAEDDENEKYDHKVNLHEPSTSSCSDLRALELENLRQDMDNLQAVLEKMMASHKAETTSLKCQLQRCSGDVQSGLDNVTKLMAEQTDGLIKACMATA